MSLKLSNGKEGYRFRADSRSFNPVNTRRRLNVVTTSLKSIRRCFDVKTSKRFYAFLLIKHFFILQIWLDLFKRSGVIFFKGGELTLYLTTISSYYESILFVIRKIYFQKVVKTLVRE